jgi:tRNA G46 methylase TrmB
VVRVLKQSKTGRNLNESGLVISTQQEVHPGLEACVRKHLESPWLQPLHRPSQDAWQLLDKHGIFFGGQPLILDSGCGTGKSTRRLARLFPGHIVIGVDQSSSRLAKSGMQSNFLRLGNCVLLRAELATFWRLLLENNIKPERNFLFYPNPWPKPGHLSRRWHGHPVFPQLLALGGEIEMRCNWEVYAREFAMATGIATGAEPEVNKIQSKDAVSPFEQKYLERGQSLYSVHIPIGQTQASRQALQGH